MQQRVLSLLHFGLREGGTCSSATARRSAGRTDCSRPSTRSGGSSARSGSRAARHLRRSRVLDRARRARGAARGERRRPAALRPRRRTGAAAGTARRVTAPPTVVVDRRDADRLLPRRHAAFLAQPAGEPTRDLCELAAPGVRSRSCGPRCAAREREQTVAAAIRAGVRRAGSPRRRCSRGRVTDVLPRHVRAAQSPSSSRQLRGW